MKARDLVTVSDAILMGRQQQQQQFIKVILFVYMALLTFLLGKNVLKEHCLYRNPMSNNFHKTSLLNNSPELETLGHRQRILRTKF